MFAPIGDERVWDAEYRSCTTTNETPLIGHKGLQVQTWRDIVGWCCSAVLICVGPGREGQGLARYDATLYRVQPSMLTGKLLSQLHPTWEILKRVSKRPVVLWLDSPFPLVIICEWSPTGLSPTDDFPIGGIVGPDAFLAGLPRAGNLSYRHTHMWYTCDIVSLCSCGSMAADCVTGSENCHQPRHGHICFLNTVCHMYCHLSFRQCDRRLSTKLRRRP